MATTQREIRYLTTEELIRLRRHAEARALQAKEAGAVTTVRSWALLDTLLSSGLRASEIASPRSETASSDTARPRWWSARAKGASNARCSSPKNSRRT